MDLYECLLKCLAPLVREFLSSDCKGQRGTAEEILKDRFFSDKTDPDISLLQPLVTPHPNCISWISH